MEIHDALCLANASLTCTQLRPTTFFTKNWGDDVALLSAQITWYRRLNVMLVQMDVRNDVDLKLRLQENFKHGYQGDKSVMSRVHGNEVLFSWPVLCVISISSSSFTWQSNVCHSKFPPTHYPCLMIVIWWHECILPKIAGADQTFFSQNQDLRHLHTNRELCLVSIESSSKHNSTLLVW